MQTFSSSDPFAGARPSLFANTLFLVAIMALYPLVGILLFSLVSGGGKETLLFSRPEMVASMLSSLRFIQAAGQILVLALPVIILTAWHTRNKKPFSLQSLAFLGIKKDVDFGAILLAVVGLFLLQPLLQTLTELQNLYLWPALGSAGTEVVRQRDLMDSFIRELGLVRSAPEFLAVAFVFAITPAFSEEVLFRGYIQQNYTRSMSSGKAVFLTGFVFAFFHLSAANLLPLALLGWYIGYIYSKTGNLAVPFFVHLANNLAALLFLLFGEGEASVKASGHWSLLDLPLWWMVVGGSLFLFMVVIRRFSSDSFPGQKTEKFG
ncbi:MAG: CPBP family intramembrane metalloprotease [Chlorobium sp.]|nr:MAG: CPBP family intramembrane metalloprotease [Chlorobium sp.]